MKKTVLHLAIDYDNPHRGRPTEAIKLFIRHLDVFENVVVSLRRVANPWAVRVVERRTEEGGLLIDYAYFGLPGGIGLALSMAVVARTVARILEKNGIVPDVVHAHKLTFEGISAWLLARSYEAHLVVSIRGEVERKIFRWKPLYRFLYRKICADCHRVYFVSAWFVEEYVKYIGRPPRPLLLLPNVVGNATPDIPVQAADRSYVSVLNLNDWQRKGLGLLLGAIAALKARGVHIDLAVIGGGDEKRRAEVNALVERLGIADRVAFLGRVPNAEVLAMIGRYRALLLPSRNETFGMVYAEALFSGIPVMMNRGSAIDGYINDLDVAVFVYQSTVEEVTAAILDLDLRVDELRANIQACRHVLYRRLSHRIAIARYVADLGGETMPVDSEARVPAIPVGVS
jgi:glycosyltransferase involved in cell wall biosynthesis